MGEGEKAIEYNGWGTVYAHDEDYCPSCWPVYCHENGVDTKTGKDLQGLQDQQQKGCHLARLV